MIRASTLAVTAAGLFLFACGGERKASQSGAARTTETAGGAPAAAPAAPAATGTLTVPGWMKVDKAKKMVAMDVVAGQTPDNNHWNFNGLDNGKATMVVPAGYTVRVSFKNNDPAVAHSFGIDTRTGDFPPTFDNPQPAFPGAISSNPTDPTKGTQPGKSETITFTASKPGQYSALCYMPGHAAAGMWVHFNVSGDGSVGVSGAS
jgi:uncharacterized cupredoxin-like copper-binding protein